LFGGMAVGLGLMFGFLYYNPMSTANTLSPISVTDNEVVRLNYSAVTQDALIYTNDGEAQIAPHPAKVQQLWEAPVRFTTAMVTVLDDSRGQVAGIGVKFSSRSEQTNILRGEVLMDSVWHIYLPARGSLFMEQSENYWGYIRDIVVPARWSSGDNWRGSWLGNITAGPGALGTAAVAGGSGQFQYMTTEGVESFSAKAYSVEHGPVAMTGELAIEIPGNEDLLTEADD
jgi:hypothetical protein